MTSDSPLSRKTIDKWKRSSPSPLLPDDRADDSADNIFSRPGPPLLTKSLSMEDLTSKEQQSTDLDVPATSLYEIDQRYLKVPGGSDSTFSSPAGKQGRESVAHDSWVTVFGFPSGSLPIVLSVFKSFGPISKYEEGSGNWIDICYGNKWSAQKALSKNGTVLAGTSLMIGVVPRQTQSANIGFLTSPVKKASDESRGVSYNIGDGGKKNIFVSSPFQTQPQSDSFPVRLFKFIMGW